MSAGTQDLFLDQSTNFVTELVLKDVNGNPYDLTGCVIASQAKRSYYSANAVITFVPTILDASNGIITLATDPATTANISPGTLVYDVLVQDPSNNIIRILEGRIFVDPAVTNLTFI